MRDEPLSDARLAEIRTAADQYRGSPSVRRKPNSAIAHRGELLAEVDRLRRNEAPRPFLPVALAEITPEFVKRFEDAWAKIMADPNSCELVVVEPTQVATVEWEVRYDDGTLSGAVLVDYEDARQLATRRPGLNPKIVYRTVSEWREADRA